MNAAIRYRMILRCFPALNATWKPVRPGGQFSSHPLSARMLGHCGGRYSLWWSCPKLLARCERSGRSRWCLRWLVSTLAIATAIVYASAPEAAAQERREREANSVYAARRAKLASQIDGPILLWGFTGREEGAQTYIF